MATLVMRADASSNFAPDKRWGYFPSVSAGWGISNESFMEDLSSSWMDFFKLRASWGRNGNQAISPFQYLSTIAFDSRYFPGIDKTNQTTAAIQILCRIRMYLGNFRTDRYRVGFPFFG